MNAPTPFSKSASPRSCVTVALAVVMAASGLGAAHAGPATYLLSQTAADAPVEIAVVPRDQINDKLFMDVAGVRLWVRDAESLARIRSRIADPAAAHHLIQPGVADKLRETGIEPDLIPVRGDKGKALPSDLMVPLPAGEFERTGHYFDSSGGGFSRLPDGRVAPSQGDRYKVRVSAFAIDRYKVTNEDYCRFLNDGNEGYRTPWNPRIARSALAPHTGKFVPADRSLAKHPVVLVNWFQARGYAQWAGKRLPTEAEWEYAACGKEGRTYPWGNEAPDDTRGDFPVKYKHPVPVDWFPAGATPEGVFQLAQNSAEWCADYFDVLSYNKAPKDGLIADPKGPATGHMPETWYKFNVVMKGWCKASDPEHFTCTKRHGRGPFTDAAAGISFRCAKSLP